MWLGSVAPSSTTARAHPLPPGAFSMRPTSCV
jgi:hypothetical protein